MANRGRPPGLMTRRRKQVLAAYVEAAAEGMVPRWTELARRCGIYDYRNAKRIVKELKQLGRISA